MLPLENLDKKLFKEILEQSRKNIHKFTNEWTDENYHDPGITFLEMFSWLTEMQRYYLNIVTDRNKKKFFKLYDIELKTQQYANTYVFFPKVNEKKFIPEGMKLKAEEQIFQTDRKTIIHNNELKKVLTVSNGKMIDNTYYNYFNSTGTYNIFGAVPEVRNRVYIGLDEAYENGTQVDILFKINTEYPVSMSGSNVYDYGIKGRWFVFTKSNKWNEVKCISNDTESFTKTGVIKIRINGKMAKSVIGAENDSYYWLMYEVDEVVSQIPPKIDYVKINTVKVVNKNEIVKTKELPGLSKRFVLEDYLSIFGEVIIQFNRNGYWFDLEEDDYNIKKRADGRVELNLSSSYEDLRIISHDDMYTYLPHIGSGNGLPNQVIQTKLEDVVPELLTIQIGKLINNRIGWRDLEYVEDFIESNCEEYCFTLDIENNHVIFGNGECGIIPEKLENNIRFSNYVCSNRERGNVKQYEIDEFLNAPLDWQYLKFYNNESAIGGETGMNIEMGKEEIIKDHKKIYRAVTAADYEELIKNIPGIRISLAKAIVDKEDRNRIMIVAVPYTGEKKPKMDSKLMRILYKYIQKYRLITTEVKIIKPIYVEIYVRCILVVNKIDDFNRDELYSHIEEFLNPIKGEHVRQQYRIGSPVYVSEVMKLITQQKGVNYVKRLWLDAEETDIKKDKNGNIFIPDNGVIYCEKIFIDLIE